MSVATNDGAIRYLSDDAQRVLARLRDRMRDYVPGWRPTDASSATALLAIVARFRELLDDGLDVARERALFGFLATAGIRLLPPQPARAPLTFGLMPQSPIDVPLPPLTPVAARSANVFSTGDAVTIARSRLAACYYVDPASDSVADYSDRLSDGFALFDGLGVMEHALYLGHDQLFALPEAADLVITLGAPDASTRTADLDIVWEYLSADGWRGLSNPPLQPLVADDKVVLHKCVGPHAVTGTVAGCQSHWIRGRLTTPLVPAIDRAEQPLPLIDRVRAQAVFSRAGLPLDAAFTDSSRIDLTSPFRPFGRQPVQLTTFYFANRTAFSRAGAQIRLDIDLMTPGDGPIADAGVLAWEYWNGTSWIAVPSIEDFGQRFCLAHGRGVVTFPRPADWEECAVGGAHNFWARVRIDSGRTSDGIEPYGGPIRYTATDSAVVASNEPRPPVVKRIEVGYAYSTEPQPVEHCLTVNDFVFEDHTSNTRWGQRAFVPFRPTVDHDPAIYLGFDRALPAATVSVFVAVPDKAGLATIDLVETNAFAWEYLSDTGWNDLVVADETRGFAQTGTVRFACPSDAIASDGPGGKLFRIRGRVPEDTRPAVRPIGAVWMNTVWASEERSYQLEPLGISDGAPDQACFLPNDRIPVIEGETVEVREWSGDGVGWELATVDVDPTALRLERAPATGRPTAVWVRWEARPDLDASRSTDRHYAIERAGGVFRFGDGRRGMIPPGNARIAVTYRSGGGTAGNVPQRAISELRAAMPYIASATNLLPARGGAPVETLASLAARGPQRIRHRGRALAASDYEWLAREASTAVANARCLDVTAPDGRVMRGWVTVIVLPDDISPAPVPDAELLGRVRAYLAQRAPAGVSDRLSVGGPRYRVASVAADIVVRVGADPGEVETNVRDGLARFLHPVHGGPDDAGWSFGATLYVSQIARVIGRVAGVDRSSSLELAIDGLLVDDRIALRPDELPSSGTHRVRIRRAGSC